MLLPLAANATVFAEYGSVWSLEESAVGIGETPLYISRIANGSGLDSVTSESTVGVVGGAVALNGTDDYIPVRFDNPFATQTASAWVKPTALQAGTVFEFIVTISWVDNATNEDAYDISYLTYSNGGQYQFLATVPANNNEYTHAVGVCGEVLEYRIKAYNALAESEILLGGPVYTSPCVPTIASATAISPDEISIIWDLGAGNDQAELQFHNGDNNWTTLFAGEGSSYLHQGTQCGVTYSYRLKVQNISGISEWSPVTVVTVEDCAVQSPSNLTALNSTGGDVVLSWIDNADVETAFYIYRCDESEDQFMLLDQVLGDVTEYTDITTACSNRSYIYYVVAIAEGIGRSGSSNIVSIETEFCGASKKSNDLISIPIIVTNATGEVISGRKTFVVNLTEGAASETSVFSESLLLIEVVNGFANLILGYTKDIGAILNTYDNLYYTVTVDGRKIHSKPRPLFFSYEHQRIIYS